VAFVNAVLLGYKKYGAESVRCAARGANLRQLFERNRVHRVTASQFEALCRVAMQQLDDEALGWFSRRLPWGSYGFCRARRLLHRTSASP